MGFDHFINGLQLEVGSYHCGLYNILGGCHFSFGPLTPEGVSNWGVTWHHTAHPPVMPSPEYGKQP